MNIIDDSVYGVHVCLQVVLFVVYCD